MHSTVRERNSFFAGGVWMDILDVIDQRIANTEVKVPISENGFSDLQHIRYQEGQKFALQSLKSTLQNTLDAKDKVEEKRNAKLG